LLKPDFFLKTTPAVPIKPVKLAAAAIPSRGGGIVSRVKNVVKKPHLPSSGVVTRAKNILKNPPYKRMLRSSKVSDDKIGLLARSKRGVRAQRRAGEGRGVEDRRRARDARVRDKRGIFGGLMMAGILRPLGGVIRRASSIASIGRHTKSRFAGRQKSTGKHLEKTKPLKRKTGQNTDQNVDMAAEVGQEGPKGGT
jgi:hypothetical protein